MKYEYFKHSITVGGEIAEAYGIIIFSNGTEVAKIYDISTDVNKIKVLAEQLNEQKLNPFKLGEFLEEYINQENFI